MQLTTKKTWNFTYRSIRCQIVFWFDEHMTKTESRDIYPHKGIWNSYIFLRKKDLGEGFDKVKLTPRKTRLTADSPIRYIYRPDRDLQFDMHGGITFYEIARDEAGKIIGAKVGNDYNHLWDRDRDYDENSIEYDLKNSVDQMLEWLGVEIETPLLTHKE